MTERIDHVALAKGLLGAEWRNGDVAISFEWPEQVGNAEFAWDGGKWKLQPDIAAALGIEDSANDQQ